MRCGTRSPTRCRWTWGGVWTTSPSAVAYSNLSEYLNLKDRTVRVVDGIEQIALVDQEMLDRLRIDTLRVGVDPSAWKPWTLPNGKDCLVPDCFCPQPEAGGSWVVLDDRGEKEFKMADGSYHFDRIGPPGLHQ